jgi:hypothetical protein
VVAPATTVTIAIIAKIFFIEYRSAVALSLNARTSVWFRDTVAWRRQAHTVFIR